MISFRTRIRTCKALAWAAGFAIAATALTVGTQASEPRAGAESISCDRRLLQSIPSRPEDALTGSEFARRVQNLSGRERDALVRSELLAGNIPDFLRHLVPVTLRATGTTHTLTVCVLPDYLAIGTNRDFVFVPMGLEAALTVAERFRFELPTPKVVDAIYEESPVKLHPEPLPAGDQMRSTAYFVRHNVLISEQRSSAAAPLGLLTSGHKKDLVLTNRLWEIPGRVAIYGWHRQVHAPIQPLSTVHGARYADYSHGVRLVSDTVYLDGTARSLFDLLSDPTLSRLFSDEGPLRLSRMAAGLAASFGRKELQQRNPR